MPRVGSAEQILSRLTNSLVQLPAPVSETDFFVALQSGLMIDGEPEPIMLAIDQAHDLSMEGYNLLRQLVDLGEGNICLLMAGEYQLEHRLKLASFDQQEIKLVELEPLTDRETGDYMEACFRS